ncbi:extracellular solute-binding protein [Paenibacillus sp. HWE-109]|uniref:ABC transporter substrate-binding protein n=1 Tax=Paenibacillus sp. HWE-109 TaxID=1306526 RepID=UPI001EDED65A|nr:extracellular solute-binding protein [Paenibacillus sp. HWE-109]UKS26883.1 extracellular solute-binding protein [Paenibacillus sp. HWE-109]
MKKQTALVLSSAMISLTVLGGCGANTTNTTGASPSAAASTATSTPAAKPVTIKYYNWDNDTTGPATKKLIDDFQAKNPNIKVESIPLVPSNSVESMKKLDVMMTSGEQVDVVLYSNIDETMARAAQGVLAPLNDLYKKDNVNPDEEYYINPKYKGNYYATMYTASDWLVMLNEDALKDAGLKPPAYDWTWDDFRDYAKKLTKGEGNDKRYGAYFHTWGEYANPIAYTDLKNPYLTADLKPVFNDPTFAYFFNLRRAMEKDDKSIKPYSDVVGGKLSYATEFISGKTSMLLSATFLVSSLADKAKNPHTFKTIIAPMPRSSKNVEPGLTDFGASFVAIANNSKYKEEAYKFVRFMSTENNTRYDLSGWKKSDTKALLDRLFGGSKDVVDLDSLAALLSDKRMRTNMTTDVSAPYQNQLKKVLENGFSTFILDNKSAEDAQKFMMDEADKIIKQNTK